MMPAAQGQGLAGALESLWLAADARADGDAEAGRPGRADGAGVAGDATGQNRVSRAAPPAPATTIEDSSPLGVAETSSSSPISKNPGPAGEAVSGTSALDEASGPRRPRSVQS